VEFAALRKVYRLSATPRAGRVGKRCASSANTLFSGEGGRENAVSRCCQAAIVNQPKVAGVFPQRNVGLEVNLSLSLAFSKSDRRKPFLQPFKGNLVFECECFKWHIRHTVAEAELLS